MARTEHSVEIARAPEDVFPWLLEEDKVPQWTSGLEGYGRLDSGPIERGSRFRQKLEVSGQRFTIEMEVTEYDPPHGATTRFEIRGVDVVSTYLLTGHSTLTQSLEASGGGLKGRVLIPMIQPHLERKLQADLAALRELLQSG